MFSNLYQAPRLNTYSKEYSPLAVDKTHPLSRGLIALFYPQSGILINLTDNTLYPSSAGYIRALQYGSTWYNNSATDITYPVNYTIGTEISMFTFADYASLKDHAIACHGAQNAIAWADNNAGGLRPQMFAGSSVIGTNSILSNGFHCWGASMGRGDATSALFVDGVKDASGNPGTWSLTSTSLYFFDNDTSNKTSDGYHVWMGVWNRRLTDAESITLTRYSHSINNVLKPRDELNFIPYVAPAGGFQAGWAKNCNTIIGMTP